MAQETIGFIGGGRITAILLDGLARAGWPLGDVSIGEPDPSLRHRLASRFPELRVAEGNEAAAGCDFVLLAVHPPAVEAALVSARATLRCEATLVSLAPVVSLEQLSGRLGGFARTVRMIPNAPSSIGRGFNPVAHSPGLGADERGSLAALFDAWGEHPEVREEELEAWAVLTAMGPTYFWFQWQALRELGGSFGLPADRVDAGLRAMIEGAARLLLSEGLDYATVADLVPVKPLADSEASIRAAYFAKLEALYERLIPAERRSHRA